MLPIGIVLTFAGYSIGSYGWVLVKGFNITLREWFSPLNPYTWPANGASPLCTDPTVIWPTSKTPGVPCGQAGNVPAAPEAPGGPVPKPPKKGGGGTGPPIL